MGWLIIAVAFLVIGIFLFRYSQKLDPSRTVETVIEFLGIFIIPCSFTVTVVLTACLISEKSDAQVVVDQYNNTVELIQDLGVPSEAIMTEIIKTNDKILEHRVKSNKFMTQGLYSKKVAALPLLEIPEVMKVSPIDYE